MSFIEQITKAYEEDQNRDFVAVEAADIPLSYESITPQWMTNVMCKDHPGAQVLSLTLGPVDTGSSNRRKIKIEYNEAGQQAGLQEKVFCKASHDLPNRIVLASAGGLNSETTYYNKIEPELDIESPRSYLANYDKHSFNSIIVLNDITDEVESFCTHETPINYARAQSQMELLANFHGQFYQNAKTSPALSSLSTWPEYFVATEVFGMKDGSNNGFLAGEEVIPTRLFKQYEKIWPATMESVMEHNDLPNTFVHNDVHLKNWYVMPEDQMGLSDWQCCSLGHGTRDLAYSIATALTVDDRRSWERELVQFYVEKLKENGVSDVSFDETWRLYRRQLLSALTWWTITLTPSEGMPDMQPRDITLEFIRRITTAMDDLDSMSLFDV